MERGGLRAILIHAVEAATKRSKEWGRKPAGTRRRVAAGPTSTGADARARGMSRATRLPGGTAVALAVAGPVAVGLGLTLGGTLLAPALPRRVRLRSG